LPFSAPVPPHEERSACAGLSVLVIDDNHYLRDVVRVILEHEGAAVLDAAGIAQAQTLLECVVPDAVITDFDLYPEVRGGVLILERVKRRYPSCPVVLLTGRSDTYDELCEIGFDEVVFKPASTTALVGAILAAIRRCRSDSKRVTTAA
jgi:DNA-binding response OmpR family regulator